MPNITSRTHAIARRIKAHFQQGGNGKVVEESTNLALFVESQIELYANESQTRVNRNAPTDIKRIAEADFTGARMAVAKWLRALSYGPRARGATATELVAYTELQRLTVGARLTELARMGYAYDSHKRRPNPATGKPQIVWLYKENV